MLLDPSLYRLHHSFPRRLTAYPLYCEPHWFELTKRQVALPGVRQRIRLLHLSDLHASEFVPLGLIEDAITLGLSAKPDLICITGDFVTDAGGYDADDYAAVLQRLAQAAPTYAVLGNHDGGPWAARRYGDPNATKVRSILKRAGIELLHNRSVQFSAVTLVGLADLWSGEMDAHAAFTEAQQLAGPEGSRIVLAHNPDTKDAVADHRWRLMLGGHTHGGQVLIPLVGPRFLPVKDTRYIAGLLPWRDRLIHVTRGVGSIGGFRFRCRPEVSILQLHPGEFRT